MLMDVIIMQRSDIAVRMDIRAILTIWKLIAKWPSVIHSVGLSKLLSHRIQEDPMPLNRDYQNFTGNSRFDDVIRNFWRLGDGLLR
jgi:hypothetical protein